MDIKRAFHRVKGRFRRAGRLERTAWVGGLAVLSPVLVPAFLGYRHWDGRRKRAGLGIHADRPFARAGKAPRPVVDPAQEAAARARPDDFALIRIVGNDLPPRHATGQTRANVRFILENEPDLPGCEKLWLLNRIRDPGEEAEIAALIEAAGQTHRRIPFGLADYARVPLEFDSFPAGQAVVGPLVDALDAGGRDRATARVFRARNGYAMNNNGARNAALDWGRTRAKWVLPWDGNCFLAAADWARLRADVAAAPAYRYHVVPMARLGSNAETATPIDPSEAVEEPQIAFRFDAGERYDERFPYGRRPKVELLARLGVPGVWQGYKLDPWESGAGAQVPDAHLVGHAGLVRRLFSGRGDLEVEGRGALVGRGVARNEAIVAALRALDARVIRANGFDPARPLFYAREAIDRLGEAPDMPLAGAVKDAARTARARGPYAVTDKTGLAPGANPHDYLHPAPYWWPNPRTPDGLPYVRRDGERLPGTEMHGPGSEGYDRTRLQGMVDDTIACALDWAAFGTAASRDHARRLVRTWFLDPETAMTPHLRQAQVRRGHGGDEGDPSGVIEFKDIAYLLDAVRLLADADLSRNLSVWLSAYRDWLVESPQGQAERRATNNHGVFHDLHLGAVAAFIGDVETLMDCYILSASRVRAHFDEDGAQPHELARTQTRHYCAFNLQGWLCLMALYRACGFPTAHQPDFAALDDGVRWLLDRRADPWPHPQAGPFDADRLGVIAAMAGALGLAPAAGPADRALADRRPCLHAHDGVPPFWPLVHPALADTGPGAAS